MSCGKLTVELLGARLEYLAVVHMPLDLSQNDRPKFWQRALAI